MSPTPSESRRRSERIERLLASAESKVRRTRRQARPAPPPAAASTSPPAREPVAARRELVVVGASTGGPPVLTELLLQLGAGFAVPIVVVQHMLQAHLEAFAALLTRQTGRQVVLARDGQPLEPGGTYLAGPDHHLVVRRVGAGLTAALLDTPPEHEVRPAVDPLFHSAASVCGASALGVICTGMGADGAAGAVALRRAGAPVVVQDQASSVVWGMPGATVRAGGADAQVPASGLAAWVRRLTTNHTASQAGQPTGQIARQPTGQIPRQPTGQITRLPAPPPTSRGDRP